MTSLNKVLDKLEEHERRIRRLEDTMMELKGELRINTALTMTILGAILSLIMIIVKGG